MTKSINHVAMLLRISREKKGEDVDTLANHRQILTEFCEENKWTFEEFGEVISGGKVDLEDRKELQRLLDNIEKFDAIVCVELSRISRNGLISQTVKQYCIDYDIPIITPYQTYDLANNETDRLMYDVGSMIASHEHGVIGKRSKANKIQMAKQGLHISGGIPFGYRRNPKTKKLEIEESEGEIIRYIFKLHSQGLGSHKIRDILNAEGYKPARSEKFNLPSIKRIIRNEHYKGWTVFNNRKRIKKNGKTQYEVVESVVVKDTHPPIIPVNEWDAANKDREERAEHMKQIRERPIIKSEVTMLKDLVYCAKCGWKMTIRRDYKDSIGYTLKRCESITDDGSKCNTLGIKSTYVENLVMEEIQEFKNKLVSYLELVQSSGGKQLQKEREQRIKQIDKQLKQVEKDQKGLIDLALSGLFTNDEIREKKQELINLKQKLDDELEELSKEESLPDIEDVTERVGKIIDMIDNLPNLNPEQVNEALKTFIKKIYYERDMPLELQKKSTRNPERKNYPFKVSVEYYQL